MQINNLKISNFGIIKNAQFDFKKGINLILGDNGNGKSFVLKAISFMLINFIEKTIADYCNWDSDKYDLRMELEHHGKLFKFHYNYIAKNNKLNRELYIDDEYFQGKDVVDELAKYFDPALCKSSIISFQGQIDLVNSTPSEKREGLKKIYNLDFSNQIKEADLHIKDLESKDLVEIRNNIFMLNKKTYEFRELKSLPFTEEDKNKLEDEKHNLEKEIQNYEIALKSYLNLLNDIKQAENNINNTELELQNKNNKLVNLKNKKEQLSKKYEEKNWNLNLEKLEAELANISFIRPPKSYEKEIEEINSEISDLMYELKKAEDLIKASENDICPVCERPFSSHERENYKEHYNQVKFSLEEKEKIKKEFLDKQKEYEKVIEQNEKNKYKKQLLESKIESERINIENNKQLFKKDIESITNEISILEGNIEEIKNRLKMFKDTYKNLSERLPEKKPEIDSNIEIRIKTIESMINNYNKIKMENEIIKKENEKIKKQKEEDKKLLKQYLQKEKEIVEEIKIYKRYKVILQKEFPNYVIDQMIGGIEVGIQDIVNRVYDKRYKVKIIKTKNGIDVVYGKKDASISVASGFEKELFNLGYKHAFSKISNLGVLILDEIDSFASEENSEKLFNVIGELKDLYNQVFVVTHKSNVQEILMRDYNARCYIMNNGEASLF